MLRPSTGVDRRRLGLEGLLQNLHLSVNAQLNGNAHSLERLMQRIFPAVDRAIEREKRTLEQATIRLVMLDPSLVLQRGYVWLTVADGTPVRTVSELSPMQKIQATLADGTVDLQVLDSTPN
jgi:exodeoxyribonuclease VII large subunit